MSRSPATGERRSFVRLRGPTAVVWITVVRGVMAIVLGLALALHRDRAPAALANFMGVYWILTLSHFEVRARGHLTSIRLSVRRRGRDSS